MESKEDWSSFNEYYRKNPPTITLDDSGIRHQVEILNPAIYEKAPCLCGIIHDVIDGTWYHSYMKFFEDANAPNCIKIVKRCKNCHEILMLSLKKYSNDLA